MSELGLAALFAEGQQAHPGVRLGREAFGRFVEPLLGAGAALHGADLYLACAALEGDPQALATLEASLLSQVPAYVARRRLAPDALDELTQATRALLLVAAPGQRPKLAEYAGRGPLGAWLRVLVLRLAGRLERGARPQAELDEATQASLVAHSPEHLLARARWQQTFDAALREAFEALQPEQRALFRFQFGQGMTLDQIAAVLGMHRATAARHIAAAREELWAHLTRLLRERLRLGEPEVHALLDEWRSKLDLSLSGLLRESVPPERPGGTG